jgi:hypothetical protein
VVAEQSSSSTGSKRVKLYRTILWVITPVVGIIGVWSAIEAEGWLEGWSGISLAVSAFSLALVISLAVKMPIPSIFAKFRPSVGQARVAVAVVIAWGVVGYVLTYNRFERAATLTLMVQVLAVWIPSGSAAIAVAMKTSVTR